MRRRPVRALLLYCRLVISAKGPDCRGTRPLSPDMVCRDRELSDCSGGEETLHKTKRQPLRLPCDPKRAIGNDPVDHFSELSDCSGGIETLYKTKRQPLRLPCDPAGARTGPSVKELPGGQFQRRGPIAGERVRYHTKRKAASSAAL